MNVGCAIARNSIKISKKCITKDISIKSFSKGGDYACFSLSINDDDDDAYGEFISMKSKQKNEKNRVEERCKRNIQINRVPMTASYKLKHLSAIFSFLCRQMICCCKHFDICCMDINESCQRELKCCHCRCVFRIEIKLINKSIG